MRAAARRRNFCASSFATSSAAIIRPTGRCGRRSCRSCRTRPSAPSRTGCGGFNEPDLEAALVAIDPATGDILALVGGRDFRQSQFNRAVPQPPPARLGVQAVRLCRGARARLLAGVGARAAWRTSRPQGPDEWAPRNAEGETPDALTLRAALIESNNRAADRAAAARRIAARPAARVRAPGCATCPTCHRSRSAPALVTPLDLTAAFAMFPNGGLAVRPRGIVRVLDADGGTRLRQPVRTAERVISPQTAFQMVSMLEDVIDRGTGARRASWGIRFPAAAKTGTTDDFKDAWFVGFSIVGRGRRVGRLRSADDDRPRGVRRAVRAADLGRLHEPRGRAAAAAGIRGARRARARSSCATCRTCGRSRDARSTPSTSRKGTTSRRGCARFTAARSSSG